MKAKKANQGPRTASQEGLLWRFEEAIYEATKKENGGLSAARKEEQTSLWSPSKNEILD